ncbi:hypothetical protein DXG01_010665 [Tephrocybe rancida]|nr:hypothetical protein DXG01_010665 [Tephrocybe rancida]
MSTPDLSLPLATLLREGTRKAHETVENSEGALALLSGRLPKEEYIRYLMMLWHVYECVGDPKLSFGTSNSPHSAFEQALEHHATHPTLEPTYNPTLLARGPPLAADISFLLDVPESSWKSHPIHIQLLKEWPQALTDYVGRVRELADSPDPSPLLAHSYVRYLGDLSGGQIIRRTIGKAYGLDEALGQGLTFYAFKELTSAKPATQGEMKHIKDWFRAGMNKAGEQGEKVKASVVNEANIAFELNTAVFTAINTDVEESKEIPIIVEQPSQEKTYPISQVIAVVAAVCLAHFVLVTGGFTGDRGFEKLVAVQQWFSTHTGSASE